MPPLCQYPHKWPPVQCTHQRCTPTHNTTFELLIHPILQICVKRMNLYRILAGQSSSSKLGGRAVKTSALVSVTSGKLVHQGKITTGTAAVREEHRSNDRVANFPLNKLGQVIMFLSLKKKKNCKFIKIPRRSSKANSIRTKKKL